MEEDKIAQQAKILPLAGNNSIVTPERKRQKNKHVAVKQEEPEGEPGEAFPAINRSTDIGDFPANIRLKREPKSEDEKDVKEEPVKQEDVEDESEIVSWRDCLPDTNSKHFPKKFTSVLDLMDELALDDLTMKPTPEFGFREVLFSAVGTGNRPGKKTRDKLRDRKKDGDARLNWHKPRSEYAPPDSARLEEFIEVLLEVANEFA